MGLLAVLIVIGVSVGILNRVVDPLQDLPVISIDLLGSEERDAIQNARRLVERKPDSGPSWGRLGMVLLAHNFEDAAIVCFSKAGRLDRNNSRWPYSAGVALSVTDPEQALQEFARAAELAPHEPWASFRRAELLMDLQRLDEAERTLQSIQANEQPDRLNFDRVRLALLTGKEALQALKPAQLQKLQSGLNRRAGLELLAQVWRRLGKVEQAESISQQLRDLPTGSEGWPDPFVSEILELSKDPTWMAGKAQQDFDAGQIEVALSQMDQLILDHPQNPDLCVRLARMLSKLQRVSAGINVLSAAGERMPDSAQIQFELGNLLYQSNNWSAAVTAYRRATQLKPDFGRAYFNLAQTRTKLKQPAEAVTAFQEALRCQPDLVEAHVHLAVVLLEPGQSEDAKSARRHIEQALKLSPQNGLANQLLQKLEKP